MMTLTLNRPDRCLHVEGWSGPDPEADRWMVHCLHQGPLPDKPPQLPLELAERLVSRGGRRSHPLLGHRLRGRLPEAVQARLDGALRSNLLHNLLLIRDLTTISRDFRARGISLLLLKGLHLALQAYPQPGLRVVGDLDLLIRPAQLDEAEASLSSLGFKAVRPFRHQAMFESHHHLYPYVNPKTGTMVELHWSFGGRSRLADPAEVDGVWRRSADLELPGGERVAVMAAEHLLAYLVLHSSHQHRYEFGPSFLADITAVMRVYGTTLDWVEFLRRVQAWGCGKGTYLTLRICRDHLGSEVPDSVLEATRPGDFEEIWMSRALEIVLAVERYRGSHTLDRWLAAQSWRERFQTGLQAVFRDRSEDEIQYRLDPASSKARLRLARRLTDLWRRYRSMLVFLFQAESLSLRRRSEIRGHLGSWLNR